MCQSTYTVGFRMTRKNDNMLGPFRMRSGFRYEALRQGTVGGGGFFKPKNTARETNRGGGREVFGGDSKRKVGEAHAAGRPFIFEDLKRRKMS